MQEVMQRADAKARGLTRYFTGKPCKHGHVTDRIVSNGACLECANARKARWKGENAESLRANSKAWAKNNPDRVLAAKRKYEAKNAQRVTEMKRAYRQRNPEKIKAKNARWLAENKDRMRALNAAWYRDNKDKAKARDVRRRTRLQRSMVAWHRELTDLVVTEAAYLAASREAVTGFKWHIDHMLPLKCKVVSGLHVWSNLQVIPARLNAKKHNRLILTNPGEWILFS